VPAVIKNGIHKKWWKKTEQLPIKQVSSEKQMAKHKE